MAGLLSEESRRDLVRPILMGLFDDKSWRVRYMVAEKLDRGIIQLSIQEGIGEEMTMIDLVPAFTSLLKDPEGEVRGAAAQKLNSLLQHVKAELAGVIMDLAPLVGKENTLSSSPSAHFMQLLKDSTAEVRLNIISSLNKVNDVIGTSQLSQSLFPAIVELAEDGEWRVRLADCSAHASSCSTALYAIREAATVILTELAGRFGGVWATKNIMPKVLTLSKDPNYLHRMTCLFCLNSLAAAVGPERTAKEIMPVIKELSEDNIPNVRLNVAKGLLKIGKVVDASLLQNEIKPILLNLCNDADFDVRYFAEETKSTLGLH
ncbi:HEAT repeat protein [Ostertagia ostertagi]